MNFRISSIALLLVAGASPAGISADTGADDFAPELPPVENFSTIWKRSPFIVETKVVEDSAGLAARYSLTGIAELGGKPVVFLRDKRSLLPLTVAAGQPNQDGLEVVSIIVNEEAKNSVVTIRQGEDQAEINFDPAAFQVTGQVSTPANPTVPASPPKIVRPTNAAAGTSPQTPPMGKTTVPPPPSNNSKSTPPSAPKRIIRPPINTSK